MTEQLAAEIFREASESIEVLAPPYDEVVAESGAQRRRLVRTVVAGVAAAAVVLGGLTWLASRGPAATEDLSPAAVTNQPNPVGVAWYAGGRLHLEKVSVEVPAVTDLVELNGGAVYGDREGTIAFVAADGQRRLIGHKDPDVRLVGSTGEGWVSWVDPDGSGGGAALKVYSVSGGAMLATQELQSAAVRPIAIDQRQVYYETPDGTYAWAPGAGPPVKQDRNGLVDVESTTRVYQLAGPIEMAQAFFSVSYIRPGTGASLSGGGLFVLSKVPGPGVADGGPFRPLLYDARSGDRLPSGVGPDERAIDAAFGRDHTVVYLIAPDVSDTPDVLGVLRTCDLGSAQCTDVAPVQVGVDRPMLAQ